MSLALFFFVVFVPFVFSFIIAFVIFCKRTFHFIALLVLSLLSLASLLLASFTQALISLLVEFQNTSSSFFTSIFRAYVYSSFIEECSKIFVFYLFAKYLLNRFMLLKNDNNTIEYVRKNCREKTNIILRQNAKECILLIMFFASSFAGFENIAYIAIAPNIWPYRLFSASLLHILLSPIYVGALRNTTLSLFSSIIVATILHGSYNFIASNMGLLYAYAIIALLLIKNIFYFSQSNKNSFLNAL